MIEVKYIKGKDKLKENWRLIVKYEPYNQTIEIKTENFEMGFRTGEDWDHITDFPDHYTTGVYEYYVSYISKNPINMDNVLDKMVDRLYQIIQDNIKIYDKKIKNEIQSLERLKLGLSCPLFRDKKIDKIIE